MGKKKVPINNFAISRVDPSQFTTIGHLIDKLGGIDKHVIKTMVKKDLTRAKGVNKTVEKKDPTGAKGVIMTGAKVTKVNKVTKRVIKTVEKIDYCANTKSVEKKEKITRQLDIQQTTAVGVIKRVEKKDPTGGKVTKAAAKKGAK